MDKIKIIPTRKTHRDYRTFRKTKRAQITFFIIIGFVIFVILASLFWIKSYAKSQEFLEEKEEIEGLFSKQGKYYNYVSSCVQQAAKQGLILAGTQGGVIYETQAPDTKKYKGPADYHYGEYILPFEYEDVFEIFPDEEEHVYEVSYAIYRPDLTLGIEGHPGVPDYPYGNVLLTEDPTDYSSKYRNPFGNIMVSPITPLCDYYGENKPGKEGAKYTCETYDSRRETDTDSIQEYLESYIAYNAKECVNFDSMPEVGDDIEKGDVTATVIFTQDNVHVSVLFPIELRTGDEAQTISLQTYETSMQVRFKKMHELFTRLVEEDINNIFFDIQRDSDQLNDCKEFVEATYNVPCLRPGMKIYRYSDVCSDDLCNFKSAGFYLGRYDDVVVLEDSDSNIDGKPFLFFIAIQNREPALDFLHEIPDDASGVDYDYIISTGDEIFIDPYGYDPDEDSHNVEGFMEGSYIYAHWKEDWDEEFDPSSCLQEEYYEDVTNCQIKTWGAAYPRFTTSEPYENNSRQASLQTGELDIGKHNLLVQLCDNEGRCDHQNVKILVFKDPDIEGFNNYEDVNNSYMSLEDPYTIIDFASLEFGEAAGYEWEIANYNILDPVSTYTLSFSDDLTSGYVGCDIEDMTQCNSDLNPWQSYDVHLTKTMSVMVMNGGTDDDVFTFETVDCYPHQDESPAYPYNTNDDPFQANHTCCAEDYTIKTGDICYEGTQYTCSGNILQEYQVTDTCQGDRGNICGDGDDVPESSTIIEETDCGECKECNATQGRCVAIPDDPITNCGGTPICADGYNSTGPGVCEEGICVASGMQCDYDCGAECISEGEFYFDETNGLCKYDCEDCFFQQSDELGCEGDECWDNQEFCWFDAECTAEGREYSNYRQCLPPAEVYDDPSGLDTADKCFTDPAECENNVCKSQEFFPEDCLYGNPGAGDNYCWTSDDECYYPNQATLCTEDGWDHDIYELDCDAGSIADGHCWINNICYTDFGQCDSSGFDAQTSNDCPEP